MTEKGNGSSGTRTLRKTFMEWQDEIEEEWLHRMSLEGWHLERVKPGIMHCKYYFNRGEPKYYVYRLDYPDRIKDREDYLETFREAGWIHLERLPNGWEYFRTGEEAPPGENVEIYTDNSSRIEKYKRMLWFMLIISGILLANIYNMFISTFLRVSGGILYPVMLGFTIVTIPLVLLLLYTIFKLLGRIKSLSKAL